MESAAGGVFQQGCRQRAYRAVLAASAESRYHHTLVYTPRTSTAKNQNAHGQKSLSRQIARGCGGIACRRRLSTGMSTASLQGRTCCVRRKSIPPHPRILPGKKPQKNQTPLDKKPESPPPVSRPSKNPTRTSTLFFQLFTQAKDFLTRLLLWLQAARITKSLAVPVKNQDYRHLSALAVFT